MIFTISCTHADGQCVASHFVSDSINLEIVWDLEYVFVWLVG